MALRPLPLALKALPVALMALPLALTALPMALMALPMALMALPMALMAFPMVLRAPPIARKTLPKSRKAFPITLKVHPKVLMALPMVLVALPLVLRAVPMALMAFLLSLKVLPSTLASDSVPVSPGEELSQLLASFTGLKADFRQGDETQPQTGSFWLQKPGRFRVESAPPLSQVVVSNGTDLWTYDQDLAQVIVAKLDTDMADLPLLLLASETGSLQEHFQVERYEDESHQIYLLTPWNDSAIAQLALVFQGQVPKAITLDTQLRQSTQIELFSVEFDPDLPPERFELAIPEGVDVIDDRPSN